jgi:hypothetical protein
MKRLKKHGLAMGELAHKLIQKNARYVWIGGIFLTAIYYNLVIAPVAEVKQNKNQSFRSENSGVIVADIDEGSPSKVFQGMLHSRAGDWYRLGLKAQALDQDETMHIFVITPLGREKEIGRVELVYNKDTDAAARYADFVFKTDGEYQDVVVRKEQKDSLEKNWSGGRVSLPYVNISRLDIARDQDVTKLQETLFGNTDMKGITLPEKEIASDVSSFPDKTHFLFGQVFDGIEGSLLNIAMNVSYDATAKADGKYRLELHSYDSPTKTVGKDIIAKHSFSLDGLAKRLGDDGLYHFDFTTKLDAGKTYFIGISDYQVKPKNVLSVKKFSDGSGYMRFALPIFTKVDTKGQLLTNAKIEDMGTSLRYTYQSNHTPMDAVDLFETSGNVWFDEDAQSVLGDGDENSSFTYKIDTIFPFNALHFIARQAGEKEKQVRLEYSYDNTFWKEISFKQIDGKSQEFDLIIYDNERKVSAVFVRVSFSGEKNKGQVFGLDRFQITADMSKNVSQNKR